MRSITSSTPNTSFWKSLYQAWKSDIITLSNPLGPFCGTEMKQSLLERIEKLDPTKFKISLKPVILLEKRATKVRILVALKTFVIIIDQANTHDVDNIIRYDKKRG